MVDLHRQYLDIRDEVDRAIGDVIAETAFIKGPAVGLFEEELARRLEVRHCIACGNGTDALLLSLLAVGLQRGDEVIVPAFAFAAVAETVLLLGGVPVFADVDPRTFNIDPASVARLVSERTRVVIPVHLFGQPSDMAALTAVAKEHGLKVIEDNAQSLGAVCRMSDGVRRYAGTIGEIGCTSFFPSKVLGCYGDGGAAFTDDDGLAARIRALGSHGWFTKYDSRLVGMNSRLDTLQAAVLRVKLPHLDTWIAARRSVAARYTERLGGLTPVVTPAETPYATHVYHQYTVKVPPACRDGLRAALAKEGIPSMVYYPGTLYEQPAYRDACICDPAMRHAATLPAAVLSLPMDSELTDAEVERVADAVCRYFADNESRYHE